jgi:large subunit ribosomal protein L10
MALNRTQKEDSVKELNEKLATSRMALRTEYRGVTVEDITRLRKELRAEKSSYRVVKNKLFKIAAKGTPGEQLADSLVGPTGVVFLPMDGDPAAVAKVLKKFQEDVEAFEVGEGFLGEKQMSASDVEALSKLPSREELLSQLVRQMMAPIQNFHGVLSALPRNLVFVLDAIKRQKEGSAE